MRWKYFESFITDLLKTFVHLIRQRIAVRREVSIVYHINCKYKIYT